MADIFISYKREDRPLAERLSIALEQLGFEVWWDFDLLAGDSYRKVIRAVLDQCACAIVLWSTRSVESDFVVDEANHAKSQGKLCPARIDDAALPFGFGQVHTDDLRDWDGELSHPGFQALVRAVESRVGRKGKLGAQRGREAQMAAAELESFKTAQLAGTPSALRTFLASYPQGVFASFVRGQVELLEEHVAAQQPHPYRPPPTPTSLAPSRSLQGPADVFISYAHEDHDYVRQMAPALEAEGLSVWWDHAVPPGKTWDEVIAKGIYEARCCVVLWSKHSVISDWVREEATIAKDHRKFIPVQIDNVEPPVGFRRIQSAHLQGWNGDVHNAQWQMLVREIRSVIGGGQPAAPPPERTPRAPRNYTPSPVHVEPPRERSNSSRLPMILFGLAALVVVAALAVALMPRGAPPAQEAQAPVVVAPPPAAAVDPAAAPAPTPAPAVDPAQLEAARAEAERADDNAWATAQRMNTVAGYSAYLQAHPNGRSATQARAARALLQTAPPPVTYGAFDVAQLNAQVRTAAEAARAAETRANTAAQRARSAVTQAEEAARRARVGEAGYRVVNYPNDEQRRRYEGGFSNEQTNGHGVFTFGAGGFSGDRYSGQFSNGSRNGFGVYAFAENDRNTNNALRYEGEWSGGNIDGAGVYTWRSGDRHAGLNRASRGAGPGVMRYTDGRRYEGEWANDRRSGYGVLWAADGRVLQSGLWRDGRLETPLTR